MRGKFRRAFQISIHALREEGDVHKHYWTSVFTGISIHALREEGDLQSCGDIHGCFAISIHALREEGDSYQQGLERFWSNFYPRPP